MSNDPTARILLVNAEGAESREVETLFDTAPRIMVMPIKPEQLHAELSQANADLIIVNSVGVSEKEIELLNELRAEAPDVPLIVTTEDLSSEQTRRLFNFKIHDWLPKPLSSEDLLASISKGIRSNRTTNNRVHAVISCVGGAGATTIAVCMADLAANKLLKKRGSVALFDLDFSTGNCSYVLNQVSNFNLASVSATPQRIDAEFIRVIQKKHDRGFYLYSFKRPEINTDLNGYELVLRMLDAVSVEHEHTFLDIPYYATEWRDEVDSAINTCTLVTELNLPAIKHTLDLVEKLHKQRGEDFPIQIIFNKWQTRLFGQRIGKKKLKELFGDIPMYHLPWDPSLIGESVDRGVTPSEVTQRAAFLKKLLKYMKSIDIVGEDAK